MWHARPANEGGLGAGETICKCQLQRQRNPESRGARTLAGTGRVGHGGKDKSSGSASEKHAKRLAGGTGGKDAWKCRPGRSKFAVYRGGAQSAGPNGCFDGPFRLPLPAPSLTKLRWRRHQSPEIISQLLRRYGARQGAFSDLLVSAGRDSQVTHVSRGAHPTNGQNSGVLSGPVQAGYSWRRGRHRECYRKLACLCRPSENHTLLPAARWCYNLVSRT